MSRARIGRSSNLGFALLALAAVQAAHAAPLDLADDVSEPDDLDADLNTDANEGRTWWPALGAWGYYPGPFSASFGLRRPRQRKLEPDYVKQTLAAAKRERKRRRNIELLQADQRTPEGERAVEEARRLMQQENPQPEDVAAVDQRLHGGGLSELDTFWVVWRCFRDRYLSNSRG